MEKKVMARLGKGLGHSGMLEITQGRMRNALGYSISHLEALNCRCGDGFNVGCCGFVRRSKQKGRTGWQTRCRGSGLRGCEKAWTPRK